MLKQNDILDIISENTGITIKEVKLVVDQLIDIISEQIARREECRVYGLGTFRSVKTKKRIGRNPHTGDPMKIPQKVRIRFRPGYRLRMGAERATGLLNLKEIAKLMVSEILLYNSQEIDEGIRKNDLAKRLETKLRDARQNFTARIPKSIDADVSIFDEAWKRFITKRTKALEAMK